MTNIVLCGGMRKDPKVGGGVGRTREVAKNRTQHSSSMNIYGCVYTKVGVDLRKMEKVNRRMEYASSGALGALDVGFTICVFVL
ncbi:hypothetical protein Lal_00018693 [Lupinus albus]|nr:hypothetical protein Lal_00018693 [Lupinus albus]